MSGEEISQAELLSLFEAARWAPSSNNNQSWRFIYAKQNTLLADLLDLLAELNQIWAKNAAILIVVISKTTFDHSEKYARTIPMTPCGLGKSCSPGFLKRIGGSWDAGFRL